MFQISKCKDFPLGLLVLKVSYHFKAGVYVANIDPRSMVEARLILTEDLGLRISLWQQQVVVEFAIG